MIDELLKADATKDNLIDQIQDLQERLAELERFALTSQNILANKIGVGNANLDDIDSGDIATVPLTPYHDDSTIVGWSSYTNKYISYKKIGKFVFVSFYISGTSDATTTTFTLPHTSGIGFVQQFIIRAQDDGNNTIGYGSLSSGGSTVSFEPLPTDPGWTASGTKFILGQFWYEAA